MLKKALILLVVLACLISGTAVAEGKLKVTEKNLILYDDDNGYFFAKVENVGDAAVGADSGNLVVFSDDDEIILSDAYVSTVPSYVAVEPGDFLYVKEFLWDSALKDANVADYKFSVSAGNSSKRIQKVPSEVEFSVDTANVYDNYMYVTFTNPLEQLVYGFYVVGALYDTEGELIFVNSTSLSDMAVHSGSTVTVKLHIDADLVEHYTKNEITPASAGAMVYIINN